MVKEKINYVYTKEAEKILPRYFDVAKENLEKKIKDDKYVFGDDIVEITASDIEKVIDQKLNDEDFQKDKDVFLLLQKSLNYRLISMTYLVIGTFAVVIGLFYDSLKEAFQTQPQKLTFVIAGLLTIFVSYIFYLISKRKELSFKKKAEITKKNFFFDA